ncbi:MAG: peptide chain release factor N(5)-glutamine methyltransferase [Clostridia bacterium]|nr:peptide chain release factor N(5)-glutamine methyltransferase [Clostridia bacterium]
MTILDIAKALSQANIENARYEARLLVAHFESISMAEALQAEICKQDFTSSSLASAVKRRLSREPLQYILGETGFYGEAFSVSPACLIPRADTEILVEEAIRRLPKGALFADLGTGSGCIALSVLRHRPDTSAIAVDISRDALDIAKKNAVRLGLSERIRFLEADLLSPSPLSLVKEADAILSNPPYIRQGVLEDLAPELSFEPLSALNGGRDGLLFYKAILSSYFPSLFLFEIGFDQGQALFALGKEKGYTPALKKDLGGNDRVVILTR